MNKGDRFWSHGAYSLAGKRVLTITYAEGYERSNRGRHRTHTAGEPHWAQVEGLPKEVMCNLRSDGRVRFQSAVARESLAPTAGLPTARAPACAESGDVLRFLGLAFLAWKMR